MRSAGRDTEHCEALQASKATMSLTGGSSVRARQGEPKRNADFDTKSALSLFGWKPLITRRSLDDAVSALGTQRLYLRVQIPKMRSIRKRESFFRFLIDVCRFHITPCVWLLALCVSLLSLPFLYRLPLAPPETGIWGKEKRRH